MIDENLLTVRVEIAQASDKPVIANLIQLYLYDMTDDLPFPVGREGLFEYDLLERFWQHPYLIFCGAELAGFALVTKQCPITGADPCFFVAEFFVLKSYRGKGVGRKAVEDIMQRHTGKWHIGVIAENTGASAFWAKVLADQNLFSFSEHFDGEDWQISELTSVS